MLIILYKRKIMRISFHYSWEEKCLSPVRSEENILWWWECYPPMLSKPLAPRWGLGTYLILINLSINNYFLGCHRGHWLWHSLWHTKKFLSFSLFSFCPLFPFLPLPSSLVLLLPSFFPSFFPTSLPPSLPCFLSRCNYLNLWAPETGMYALNLVNFKYPLFSTMAFLLCRNFLKTWIL